jgi:hypothetical protein
MTKRTTKHEINKNWQDEFQDKTKVEVLAWIAENVPDGYTFGYDYGNECSTYGYIFIEVTETDLEESVRMVHEAAEQARRKRDREDQILEDAKRITKERNNG